MSTAFPQYAELFLSEGREHLSAINHSLLTIEQGSRGDAPGGEASVAEAIAVVFRAVHTIKGMSATMGYAAIAELSHEMESLLDRLRSGALEVHPPVTDALFAAADALEHGIEESVAGRAESVDTRAALTRLRQFAETTVEAERAPIVPSSPTWTLPAPSGAGVLVRVRLSPDTPLKGVRAFLVVQALGRLGEVTTVAPPIETLQAGGFADDFAVRLVGESSAAEVERLVRDAGDAGDVADVQVGDDAAPVMSDSDAEHVDASKPSHTGEMRQRSVRIELSRLDALMDLIGELVIARGRLQELSAGRGDEMLTETVTSASRLIGALRDEIMTSRMVPVWQVFDRFPRFVRDAAKTAGKTIDLTVEGKEIELDRSMLDEVGDPILHLLRNAIDHGIETPAERAAAGKPPIGRLLLSAERDRTTVVVRVSDDGRGIDRERVLRKAKDAGLVDAERTELTDDEIARLIARAGFTTAEQVTGMSGRGVGVDAVYTRLRALGGSVEIRSVAGRGTTVTLRLPLTLAMQRAILARVSNEQYAIPTTHVRETLEIEPQAVTTLRGREVLMHRDDVLPVIRLRRVVGLPSETLPELEQAVVIELAEKRAVLVVDDLVGQQEIVVKRVDQIRDGLRCFSGATILGDGAPALILDVGSLS